MGIDMLVLAILGGWILLSVLVCVAVGAGIRRADANEAGPSREVAAAPGRRRSRPLSVA